MDAELQSYNDAILNQSAELCAMAGGRSAGPPLRAVSSISNTDSSDTSRQHSPLVNVPDRSSTGRVLNWSAEEDLSEEEPPAGCDPDAIKLFFGNIPKTFREGQLLPLFETVGKVVELAIVRVKATQQSKGSGFLWYKTRAHAEQAIQQFNLRHTLFAPTAGQQGLPLVVRRAKQRRSQLGTNQATRTSLSSPGMSAWSTLPAGRGMGNPGQPGLPGSMGQVPGAPLPYQRVTTSGIQVQGPPHPGMHAGINLSGGQDPWGVAAHQRQLGQGAPGMMGAFADPGQQYRIVQGSTSSGTNLSRPGSAVGQYLGSAGHSGHVPDLPFLAAGSGTFDSFSESQLSGAQSPSAARASDADVVSGFTDEYGNDRVTGSFYMQQLQRAGVQDFSSAPQDSNWGAMQSISRQAGQHGSPRAARSGPNLRLGMQQGPQPGSDPVAAMQALSLNPAGDAQGWQAVPRQPGLLEGMQGRPVGQYMHGRPEGQYMQGRPEAQDMQGRRSAPLDGMPGWRVPVVEEDWRSGAPQVDALAIEDARGSSAMANPAQVSVAIELNQEQMNFINLHIHTVKTVSGAEIVTRPVFQDVFSVSIMGTQQQVDVGRSLLLTLIANV